MSKEKSTFITGDVVKQQDILVGENVKKEQEEEEEKEKEKEKEN